MDNPTVYSQTIKELQNNLLESMKQIQSIQNSVNKVLRPMQKNFTLIQAFRDSINASLPSLQSALAPTLKFQQRLTEIATTGFQLQNICSCPYIKELRSCRSMLTLDAAAESLDKSGIFQAIKSLPKSTNLSDAIKVSSSFTFSSNVFVDACKLSESILELNTGRILSEALTLPPVYSFSSAAFEIKNIMIDENSCKPTSVFKNLIKNIAKLPLEELRYVPVDIDEVEFSFGLSNIVEETLPKSVIDVPRQKDKFRFPMAKAGFIVSILSLCIAAASYCDNHETTKQTTAYQQEEISIHREMLELKRREIKLLEKQSKSDNGEVNIKSSNQNSDN